MRSLSLSLLGLLFSTALLAQVQKTYTYTTVPDDPMGVRVYTLENGLKVYLSVNKDEPRVQTNIAVRAGSKNDPASATGLAHYLEHMLFKGTHEIATTDWEKERVLLQRISDLYEQRRVTTDEAERKAIYARIDSLSHVAASFAVPNEYDKMISSIGAKGTNAYTSTEQTVYINDIPSNEMEKWMMIESVRFQELVLRLFHTELETVFEEFNRGQDNDYRKAGEAMNRELYKKHPYGTQTTIGTGEHLKNPSMVKIHEYFDTYYVPNNMAVIIAGDLDPDRTIAMVDKHFGGWKSKPVPAFTFEKEEPITAPVVVEVMGPMAEWVDMGWRFGGVGSTDAMYIDLIAGLLHNGQAGIMDLNLIQKQRVLDANAYAGAQKDYSEFGLRAEAKQGQSLEEVRQLLLDQLEALKQGRFDDRAITAVVNKERQDRLRYMVERNSMRAYAMTNAFIQDRDWKEVVTYHDRMERITKQQVIDFARKHLNDNYVCVFKRTGEDSNVFKVEKPTITPIEINRDAQSAWYQRWEQVPSARLEPEFVDHAKVLHRGELRHGVPFFHVTNPTNSLFSVIQTLELGDNTDPMLKLAVEYLPYLGTSKYGPEELQKEFFALGVQYSVNVSGDRVYLSLRGLDKDLEAGVALFEHLVADAVPDQEALNELVKDIAKQRSDGLKNKRNIMNGGMFNYARYGDRSPFKDVLSMEELRAVKAEDLVARIKDLNNYEHKVFYYGPRSTDDARAVLDRLHATPAVLKKYDQPAPYVELETTGNNVYHVDYDMVQTEMMLISKGEVFDKEKETYSSLFNEYFGSGLSSIVFQEIREAKALAYSAYASYRTPGKPRDAHYVVAYVGTQRDKLGDAVGALLDLMNDMPANAQQFEAARGSALRKMEADRTTKENIYWTYDRKQRLGLPNDHEQVLYERIQRADLEGLKTFFNENIKGRNYTFLLIGKEADMDLEALRKLGPVKKLTMKDLFGYDDRDLIAP